MPLPTRPIDDAGPLNGKTPPILISVAVTPGVSAANAGADSASSSANANFDFPNMPSSIVERGPARINMRPRARRGCCGRPSSWTNYSSFFELVKQFQNLLLELPAERRCYRVRERFNCADGIQAKWCVIAPISEDSQFVETITEEVCSPVAQRR